MAKIHVLDKHVAELIAAGEVVERPASIVKELIENAIDAGASKITVEIKAGGIGYIRITDNGSGIEKDDIESAFLRHATSKVKSANDLESIGTLGFRGEALSSIAAVAKVELTTKTTDSQDGWQYEIHGGEVVTKPTPAGVPKGTTFIIRSIFYNTPARMKFLRRDIAEGNAVAQVVDKCALSHPEVSFEFIRDTSTRLSTSGNGDLLAVISKVYDREFADNMIKVDYEYENRIKVTGYVGRPSFTRPSRTYQSFFVNNRYVRTRTAGVAVEEAFKKRIMTGRFPVCVLNIDVSLSQVDINVHPAKIEVRFSEERGIYNAVYFGVQTALSREASPLSPHTLKKEKTITPINVDIFVDETVQQKFAPKSTLPVYQNENHFSENLEISNVKPPTIGKDGHLTVDTALFDEARGSINESITVTGEDSSPQNSVPQISQDTHKDLRLIGELFNTYILLENDDGEMLVVDKHAAHERLRYEEIKNNLVAGTRQVLLSTISVTLSREEYSSILENMDVVEKFGFLVEDFGAGTLIVRETPAVLDGEDVSVLLAEIAQKLLSSVRDMTPDVLDRLYYSIACKTSVRGGDKNNSVELMEIIRRLEENPEITHCPHGRPVVVHISRNEIEKMFGRLG